MILNHGYGSCRSTVPQFFDIGERLFDEVSKKRHFVILPFFIT